MVWSDCTLWLHGFVSIKDACMNLESHLFSLLMWSGKIKPNLALHSGQPTLFLQKDFFVW